MINKNKGFTLIELLIVVAVIGILASIVVVSLSDQTATSQDAATKLSVSSLRTPAVAASLDSTKATDEGICDELHKNASSDKISSVWDGNGGICADSSLDDGSTVEDGTICCASGDEEWVVFGRLSTYDTNGTGEEEKEFYCADHEGAFKKIDKAELHIDTVGDHYDCNK